MQVDLNWPTQSRQATRSVRLLIGPPHEAPSGIVSAGQLLAKPISETARSSAAPQSLSSPPQAAHILWRNLVSIAVNAALAARSGQGPVPPRRTRSAHWARVWVRAFTNRVDSLLIAIWQVRTMPIA